MENKFSFKNKEKTVSVFQKIRILQDDVNRCDARGLPLDSLENLSTPNPPFEKEDSRSNNTRFLTLDTTLSSKNVTGYSKIRELKLVKVGLASAEKMLEWSEKILPNGKIFGEVLNANTLHYKTFKPHKGGLFCERIFGPLKDFECACGLKNKSFNDQNSIANLTDNDSGLRTFCEICDVEYTWSVIRRYQLGYIKLASPVSHLWYLRTNPSYLSLLLNIKKRDLEAIVYCTQITTLEYYWKPINSLQLSLNASTLIDSYKKYKIENLEKKTRKALLENKTKNKKSFEARKRKTKKMDRQIFRFLSTETNTSQRLRVFENDSLEIKKEYLEKSFQLSSEEFSTRSLSGTSRVRDFLLQKMARNVQKKAFLNQYNQFNQRCYKQLFLFLGQKSIFTRAKLKNSKDSRSCESLLKTSQPFLFLSFPLLKNVLSSTTSLHTVLIQKLKTKEKVAKSKKNGARFLKNKVFIRKKSRSFIVPTFNNKQKHLEVQNRNLSSIHKQKNFSNIKTNQIESFVIIQSLLEFFKTQDFQGTWDSIYKDLISSIQFISINKNHSVEDFNNRCALNGEKTKLDLNIQDVFFLYLLVLIQMNNPLILKNRKISILKATLTKKIFGKRKLDFNLLQKNGVLPNIKNSRLLVQHKQTLSLGFTAFSLYLNLLLKSINPSVLILKDFVISEIPTIKGTKNDEKKKTQKNFLFFFQTKRAMNQEIHFQDFSVKTSNRLNSRNISFEKMPILFNELSAKKKFFPCLKESSSEVKNFNFYMQILQNFVQKLVLYKSRILSDFNLRNNIYTVAYSTGWLTEKEWRYFLYYNTAQLEFGDHILIFYKSRFNSESFLNNASRIAVGETSPFVLPVATPIIGAHLIQKILFQYEGDEIRKIAKQNQNVLPKLNRQIRLSKELASKKVDFVRLYKILQTRDQIIRRLKLLRKFVKRNVLPSSTILTILPVLPPDLRPILKMQNQIAASDLNRFYQRILYRNERLKKFLKSNASTLDFEPGFEIKYAQRLLQEAVDNLIQNGKGQVKPETNSRGQPLKSLSEILKGKQGRFRQYLLGKRVDYSGRSVIVVGPQLKIYQCGLPFEMALELFLPFLIKRIFQYRYARTIVGAKTILKNQKKITWALLEEIMEDSPILLNRAPTLHRLGIQAFQPKLIEGRAILLHPLVCPAFNADFDGDQMAVHLPITVEARAESWKLMLSRNHLLSPATGEPILLPSQDMVLGCYYLTNEALQIQRFNSNRPFLSGTCFYFLNFEQVVSAYQQERIHLQTPIWLKWNGFIEMESKNSLPIEIRLGLTGSWIELRANLQRDYTNKGILKTVFVRTTAGRVLVNNIVETCVQKSFSPKIY